MVDFVFFNRICSVDWYSMCFHALWIDIILRVKLTREKKRDRGLIPYNILPWVIVLLD